MHGQRIQYLRSIFFKHSPTHLTKFLGSVPLLSGTNELSGLVVMTNDAVAYG